MNRKRLTMLVVLGAAGLITAQHDEKPHAGSVRVLAAHDIAEKLESKALRATAVEVTYEPGQAGAPHRHPGPTFGYVVEGEYEWAIDDRPAQALKAGDTFYEPTGCLHRVSRNPGKTRTRVLAVVLHSHDAPHISIPEPKK